MLPNLYKTCRVYDYRLEGGVFSFQRSPGRLIAHWRIESWASRDDLEKIELEYMVIMRRAIVCKGICLWTAHTNH
jgi:hypothetical protein